MISNDNCLSLIFIIAHKKVIDVDVKPVNAKNVVALLFMDTKLNKHYAMKGIGCGEEIRAEVRSYLIHTIQHSFIIHS